MKVLVVGSGGREHALVWKSGMSPSVDHIYVVPGNGGTATVQKVSNIEGVSPKDYSSLVAGRKDLGMRLVVVGLDTAVVAGIEAHFRDSKHVDLILENKLTIYR